MSVRRQEWLPVLILSVLSACATARPQSVGGSWNVVVISIDTLSADHLPFGGYDRNTAPFLTRFSEDNVLFENTFSQAAYTLPSHYSMLTGTFPETHRILDPGPSGKNALDPDIRTLPELLKERGYRTLWFGTPSHALLDLNRGLGRGFDEVSPARFDDPELMEQLETRLRRMDGRKFFMFVHTYWVHEPYVPEPPFDRMFDDPGLPASPGWSRKDLRKHRSQAFASGKSESEAVVEVRNRFLAQFNFRNERDRTRFRALYDGGIREFDGKLEAFIDKLRSLGLGENTLIVVTSDHGEQFWEHGGILHFRPWREELRVPWVMKVPGLGKHRIQEETLSVDLVPTLLDFLDLPRPTGIEGVSWKTRLLGGGAPSRRRRATAVGFFSRAIWDDQWKLMSLRDGRRMLFDRKSDPRELRDLSREQPEIAEGLRMSLEMLETGIEP